MNFTWDEREYCLDDQQEKIIQSDLSHDMIIIGGPGSGKTVLATQISRELINRGDDVLQLMYNVPLSMFLQSSAADLIDHPFRKINTYHKWLYHFCSDSQLSLPFGDKNEDGWYSIDWDRILTHSKRIGRCYDTIITDETQDFPAQLIRVLKNLASNVISFIDPYQALEKSRLSVDELYAALDSPKSYTLSSNHRNTKEIIEAARAFSPSNQQSKGTFTHGSYPKIIKIPHVFGDDYYRKQTYEMREIIYSHKDESILIITNGGFVNAVYKDLGDAGIDVEMYKSKGFSNIDFNSSRPKILSFGTVKGLEADVVIIPSINYILSTREEIRDMNRIYVAMTRARKSVYLLYGDDWNGKEKWFDAMNVIKQNSVFFDWE